MAKLNKILVGTTSYDLEDTSKLAYQALTQSAYDALTTKNSNTLYIITD